MCSRQCRYRALATARSTGMRTDCSVNPTLFLPQPTPPPTDESATTSRTTASACHVIGDQGSVRASTVVGYSVYSCACVFVLQFCRGHRIVWRLPRTNACVQVLLRYLAPCHLPHSHALPACLPICLHVRFSLSPCPLLALGGLDNTSRSGDREQASFLCLAASFGP